MRASVTRPRAARQVMWAFWIFVVLIVLQVTTASSASDDSMVYGSSPSDDRDGLRQLST
jgi:ABC-type microcin C transport system permease subunit YejE